MFVTCCVRCLLIVFPIESPSRPYLIRQFKRIHGIATKITLTNIIKWPQDVIEAINAFLKGDRVSKKLEDAFDIPSNKVHGHVVAVLDMMEPLGLPALIAPKNTRFRRLVLGMIVACILQPSSKLASSSMIDKRSYRSILNELLELRCADEDYLYEAMDMLAQQKSRVECALAQKHLREGGSVLYDTTSSYVEGTKNE